MKIVKKNSGPQKEIVILPHIGAEYEQKASIVADHVIFAKTLAEAAKTVAGLPSKNPVQIPSLRTLCVSTRQVGTHW